jgi:hypothetical protein
MIYIGGFSGGVDSQAAARHMLNRYGPVGEDGSRRSATKHLSGAERAGVLCEQVRFV